MEGFVYEYHHEGFFGYSLTPIFEYFSLAHLAPIILMGIAIFLAYRYRDKLRNWKHEDTFRSILGVVLIFGECAYYWRLLYVGNSQDGTQMLTFLPLEVCEWTAFLCAFMLLKKNRHLYDIVFYVTLTLGIIPLLTPAVIMRSSPAYLRYYLFWIEHTVPIFAVFYMTFVHGFRPNWRKVYKPIAALSVLATFAIIANLNIEGANFMYLAAGTAGDSLANILPSNIWLRLLVGFGIIAVLFTLVSLPQIISEIRARRNKANAE